MNILLIILLSDAIEIEYIPKELDPPPKRLYHSMVYHSVDNSVIVFGGQFDISTNFNDLWQFHLSSNRWELKVSCTNVYPSNL